MEKNYLFGSKRFEEAIGLFLLVASVFLVVKGYTVIKESRFIGSGTTATNTIAVAGEGEAYANPDIASISFTVRDDAKTVKEAQDTVESKMNADIDYLKKQGIADKDIKLENNSFYPKYDYPNCYGYTCPVRTPTVTGYEVTRSVSVKIRDIDASGKIVEGLANLGVTELNGPTFMVDDEDAVKEEARANAIANAKEKADKLAKELGVTIVRIVSFSENNGGYPYPMYAKADMAMGMGTGGSEEAPNLPQGENKYSSSVSITFEIR